MASYFISFLSVCIISTITSINSFLFWNSNKRTTELEDNKCQCYVPYHGIYNGIELNKYRGKSFCESHVYYCAKKNYCGEPVKLVDCHKYYGCFYQTEIVGCYCTPELVGTKVCGSRLRQSKCFEDILYYCKSEHEIQVIGICEMFDYVDTPEKDKSSKVLTKEL